MIQPEVPFPHMLKYGLVFISGSKCMLRKILCFHGNPKGRFMKKMSRLIQELYSNKSMAWWWLIFINKSVIRNTTTSFFTIVVFNLWLTIGKKRFTCLKQTTQLVFYNLGLQGFFIKGEPLLYYWLKRFSQLFYYWLKPQNHAHRRFRIKGYHIELCIYVHMIHL